MNADEPESAPGVQVEPEHEPVSRPDGRRLALRDLGMCALILLAAQLATMPLGSAFGDELGPLELAALVFVAHGGMLAGTLAILRRRGETLAEVGCVRPRRGWRRTTLLAAPAWILMWIVLMPLSWLLNRSSSLDEQLQIAPTSPAWIPVWCVISCMVAFVEEIVFRGFVLRRLTTAFERSSGRRAGAWANVASALAFGLMHGLDPAVITVTAGIGLYLALVTRREGGNLALAMLVHAAQDTLALTLRSSA